MTLIGWIQIALYCAVVIALVRPLGGYMTRVFDGERTVLSPVLRPVEAALYWAGRRRSAPGAALAHLHRRHAAFPYRRLCHPVRAAAPAGDAAVQSGGPVGGRRGPRVQHRGELHHQHQLAELWRREHDVLPLADAGADPPELPLGGDRHRARDGADPRLRAGLGEDGRQLLGRCHPLHALRPAPALHPLSRCSWCGRAFRRRSAPYVEATTLEGATQTIAVGPVASQIAIKMLGTNGGGFFNANAAHPFENPTALRQLRADGVDLRASAPR